MTEADDFGDLSGEADLQADGFDVATFINKRFPDEGTLVSDIDAFILKLRDAIARIDGQLASKVREHCQSGVSLERSADASLTSLEALTSGLDRLAAAAVLAETAAREAVAPARPYSIALENTKTTADALDALVAMSDAVTKLEEAAQSKSLQLLAEDPSSFSKITHALDTFRDVLSDDSSLPGPGVRSLPDLRARAVTASAAVRVIILGEFRLLSDTITLSIRGDSQDASGATSSKGSKLSDANDRLRTACSVATAMGGDVPGEVIGAHVRSRMLAFRAGFEMEKTGLGSIEKRFAWVRRELRSNWPVLAGERSNRGWGVIFPDAWDVAWRLTSACMRELGEWVSSTLAAGADRDVIALIGALSKSKEFEAELDRRFSKAVQARLSELPVVTGKSTPEPAPYSAKDHEFSGSLSSCFGPYMGTYVTQEDEHLRIIILDLLRAETWACADGGVLKSSTDLFLTIKKSMRTCAALDCRQPLFSLHKVFRKHLGAYATELVRRIPAPYRAPIVNASTSSSVIGSTSSSMQNAEFTGRVNVACALVATAEYCAVTVSQLEESLREAVEGAYASEVSMGDEQERFSAASANSIRALVSIVCNDLEQSLRAICDQSWAEWNVVGDSSQYVEEVASKFATIMPVLASKLAKPHLRFFLERLVAGLIPRYVECLYACQGMSNAGAQQLLLDAAALKGLLLRVPAIAKAQVPSTFVKYVNREMGKGEAMLKVVLSSPDMTVNTYIALIPDGSAVEFQRILDMKGLRRADAASFVLQYTRIVGPQRGLRANEEQSRADEAFDPASGTSTQSKSTPVPPSMTRATSGTLSAIADAMRSSTEISNSGTPAEVGVESVRALFRGLESSWGSIKDAGIADRLGQTAGRINESLESTAEQVKRRFAK
jgi:vacuolar protein sorting-associated protein 53